MRSVEEALIPLAGLEQEVTKLVYEVSEDDVTRAKNQFKAMQLFGIDSTTGTLPVTAIPVGCDSKRWPQDRSRFCLRIAACEVPICTNR